MATMHVWLGIVIDTDYSAYLSLWVIAFYLQTVYEEYAAMSQMVSHFNWSSRASIEIFYYILATCNKW